jgi:hypothetical protein
MRARSTVHGPTPLRAHTHWQHGVSTSSQYERVRSTSWRLNVFLRPSSFSSSSSSAGRIRSHLGSDNWLTNIHLDWITRAAHTNAVISAVLTKRRKNLPVG